MVTIPVKVSKELAERLAPLQDHLPQIIELGLRYWKDAEQARITPRQQVEHILAEVGLLVTLDPEMVRRYTSRAARRRVSPLRIGGKPTSEIIIEERNRW